jgi:hypothetical protein
MTTANSRSTDYPIELGVPDGYLVEAAIAIGCMGDKSLLPESLRAREQPSDRVPLVQPVREGHFGATKA